MDLSAYRLTDTPMWGVEERVIKLEWSFHHGDGPAVKESLQEEVRSSVVNRSGVRCLLDCQDNTGVRNSGKGSVLETKKIRCDQYREGMITKRWITPGHVCDLRAEVPR